MLEIYETKKDDTLNLKESDSIIIHQEYGYFFCCFWWRKAIIAKRLVKENERLNINSL
jgi:hypothetical protein